MVDRAAELTSKINKRIALNESRREKRAKKRQKTHPVHELHREWISSMRGELGMKTVPRWVGVDYGLAQKLVGEFGYEQSVELIRYFIRTWTDRRTVAQERRGVIPEIKLCWTLRARVLAEMEGVVSRPTSRRDRLLRGEYDHASAEASPMEGWSD